MKLNEPDEDPLPDEETLNQEMEEYDLDEIVEEENLEWKIQVSLM